MRITLVRVTAAIVAAPRRRRREKPDRKEVVIVISSGGFPDIAGYVPALQSSAHTNTFDVAAGHCTRIT